MNNQLTIFIDSLGDASHLRKPVLDDLVSYINFKFEKSKAVNLNFICTHNSRRSHMSQIWAQVAAAYYNIENVYCYSGGTEATAMFISVKETLQQQGLDITKISEGKNPVYAIKYDQNKLPIIAFSKKYDHAFNPKGNFAAIMTCDHADKNCPIIYGAEKRIPIRYEDPKAFDNTDLQSQKYLERSMQIAEEMFYVFKKIKQRSE